jgi:hypothetical protein
MTKKEFADRNIGMTFDFIRQVVAEPSLAASMTDGAEIAFVDKDAPVTRRESSRGKHIMRYKVEHIFEPVKG